MTRVLTEWCDTFREYPSLMRATWKAERLVRAVQCEEESAGEPVTDSETISGAILDALEEG